MEKGDTNLIQPELWELFVRSITAQLTGKQGAVVHMIDAVSVTRPYESPASGGYWRSRCGVEGHFTAVLHRQSDGEWCPACKGLPPTLRQSGVEPARLEKPT